MSDSGMTVWWCPGPREGEIVPDYPPIDLTGEITRIEFGYPAAPAWVERLAAPGDGPASIRIGDPPDDEGNEGR